MKNSILKSRLLLLTLVMLMILTSGCGQKTAVQENNNNSSEKQEVGEILIGVSTALTGPSPLEGERTKQGIELAIEEINQQGGVLGKKLKAIYEDDQNNTTFAVNAVNKLCSEDIVALMGPHRSNNAMAVEQIVKKNRIPYLTGATTPKLAGLNNPYVFRVRASDSVVAKIVAKFAIEELKAKNLGIFYNTDDYGAGALEVIEQYLKDNNIQAAVIEGHNTGDKDMTGQILKAKDKGVDCLIVWTHAPEGAVIARQIKELGLKGKFIGSAGLCLPTYFDLVDADISDGWYGATDIVPNNPDPIVQNFVTNFRKKYNVEPDIFASCYYNATYILADAIKRAGSTDREKIREALSQTKDLSGVYGKVYANEHGELIHEVTIVKNQGKTPMFEKVVKE